MSEATQYIRLRGTGAPTFKAPQHTLYVDEVTDVPYINRDGNILWQPLAGATAPHASSHENGGADEISVAGLSGLLADAQTPLDHEDTHISGGGDAFLSTDLLEAIVKRLRESSGPTTMLIGSVPDGTYLKRSGTAIVGDTPSGGSAYDLLTDPVGLCVARG